MEGKKLQGRKKKDTEKVNFFFVLFFVCLFLVNFGTFFFFLLLFLFVGFWGYCEFFFVFSFPYLTKFRPRLDPIDGGEIRQLHANPQEEPLDF
jgi:hypothetical protein